jgi:serine/threonine protein kinase
VFTSSVRTSLVVSADVQINVNETKRCAVVESGIDSRVSLDRCSSPLVEDMNMQSHVIDPLSAQPPDNPYCSLKNFDIVKKLGNGHFSVVFAARNRSNNHCVALKKIEVTQTKFDRRSTSLFISHIDRTYDRR